MKLFAKVGETAAGWQIVASVPVLTEVSNCLLAVPAVSTPVAPLRGYGSHELFPSLCYK